MAVLRGRINSVLESIRYFYNEVRAYIYGIITIVPVITGATNRYLIATMRLSACCSDNVFVQIRLDKFTENTGLILGKMAALTVVLYAQGKINEISEKVSGNDYSKRSIKSAKRG